MLCRFRCRGSSVQSARGLAQSKTWRRCRVVSGSQDPTEIVIAGFILDVKTEAVAVPVEFGADDRFNAGFSGRLGEFDGAVEIVFIS